MKKAANKLLFYCFKHSKCLAFSEDRKMKSRLIFGKKEGVKWLDKWRTNVIAYKIEQKFC